MARVTAIINQKGGVAKTTTTRNLSAALTKEGYKVLMIDADPQGNLTTALGASNDVGLYDVMQGKQTKRQIQETEDGDLIASTPDLAAADLVFINTGKEYRLRDGLKNTIKNYDFVFIDCPPTLQILTINALTAADDVIIPLEANIFSLEGLHQSIATIETVKKYCNPALHVAGLLFTKYKGYINSSKEWRPKIEAQAKAEGVPVYKTCIREGTAIEKAHGKQESVFKSFNTSNPAKDYKAFILEYTKQERRQKK